MNDLRFWHPRRLRGRRARNRRAEKDGEPYLVERVPLLTFLTATFLLLVTLADGLITLALLDRGCEEANPVMRYLLEQSPWAFLAGKYILTALFLPVALVMNQYRLFGTRLRVGHFIPVVATLYIVLIAYQMVLLNIKPADADDARPASSFASATSSLVKEFQ